MDREERRALLEQRRSAVAHQLRRLAIELTDLDRQLDDISNQSGTNVCNECGGSWFAMAHNDPTATDLFGKPHRRWYRARIRDGRVAGTGGHAIGYADESRCKRTDSVRCLLGARILCGTRLRHDPCR
jgi:hypothetical protein